MTAKNSEAPKEKIELPISPEAGQRALADREVYLMNTGYCRQIDQLRALATHVRPGGGISPRSHRKRQMKQLTLCP